METTAPTRPGDSAIRWQDVTKTYADGTNAVELLNLDVASGELAVLVGPSGCGKTTTMRMVNRLVDPSSGTVSVNGRDITDVDPVELRRGIGYVIQQTGLFPHQTIAANVATVPSLLGWDKKRTKDRVDELLELVGLDPAVQGKRYPHELSGGQRQRVGVARALAADPPVLLMDEPFGAVDPVARGRLQSEFLRLQEQVHKTIVFVTHDIDEAIALGDRIAVMREGGHLEQFDTPANVLSAPASTYVRDFVGSESTLRRLAVGDVTTDHLERWSVVAPDTSLAECARVMDADKESAWAVVGAGDDIAGWLARSACSGDGVARDRMIDATVVHTGESLDAALAAVLAHDAPGAVVMDGGRYCGVLTAAGVLASAARPAA